MLGEAVDAAGMARGEAQRHGPADRHSAEIDRRQDAFGVENGEEIVDVPIMIVHVSNREAMEEIRRAQTRGLKIYGETCPQYLVLTEKDLDSQLADPKHLPDKFLLTNIPSSKNEWHGAKLDRPYPDPVRQSVHPSVKAQVD